MAKGPKSFGPIAIRVLNDGLRPFLAKWHPLLKAHEDVRPPNVSMRDHERAWVNNSTLRIELAQLQQEMLIYAHALIEIAGAENG